MGGGRGGREILEGVPPSGSSPFSFSLLLNSFFHSFLSSISVYGEGVMMTCHELMRRGRKGGRKERQEEGGESIS